MALLREFCVDGLILDYQNPSSDQDPSKAAIASAFPLVIQAAAAHNLSWAVMYDTSSKGADWGRNDPTVVQDWTEIMQLAADFRNQTLRDSAGNSMFFAFGPTPMPAADARCEKCAFYSQDGRDQGRSTALGEHGAFAWIEPKAPSSYLPGFYEGGPGADFADGAPFPKMLPTADLERRQVCEDVPGRAHPLRRHRLRGLQSRLPSVRLDRTVASAAAEHSRPLRNKSRGRVPDCDVERLQRRDAHTALVVVRYGAQA